MIKKIIHSLYTKIFWPLLPNGIYCFNYHRIGDKEQSQFDPNIFSCTAEVFEQQLTFFNKYFIVISIEQLIEKINKNQPIDQKYAVITFDDGYIDNYSIAYPLLKKYKTPAAFYVATNYLDQPHIPWWDEIAWIVRNSKVTKISFKNSEKVVDTSSNSIDENVKAILKVIKEDSSRDMAVKITELESACQCKMPDTVRNSPLFFNWQQAKEMSDDGMHIGSHTLSHNILSHLSEEQQKIEITKSKEIIEQNLNIPITSIAYPVGGRSAFTDVTQKLARKAGYKIAFSFISGVIHSFDETERYQFKRLPVDGNCNINELKNIIVRNK